MRKFKFAARKFKFLTDSGTIILERAAYFRWKLSEALCSNQQKKFSPTLKNPLYILL